MSKVYNFAAGPSMLPEEVMKEVQAEFLNYNGMGASVIEISHRSKEYMAIAEAASSDLRDLMNIPDNYKILFMHGGGRGVFANLPMNLAKREGSADYLVTGAWSGYAADEAKKYTNVNFIKGDFLNDSGRVAVHTKDLPLNKDSAYVHLCMNETIHGIEIYDTPDTDDVPLIADISSCILSRRMDVSKFGMLYGGAQKNIGPSGITIVIVREDLIGHAQPDTPAIWDYKVTADHDSMLNTPNTFAWYFAGKVFKWLKRIGGVEAMEAMNKEKSELLYGYIDSSDFYTNNVDPAFRSRMNVPFFLKDTSLDQQFIAEAKENNLISLKGHRVLGGMRASIYNAMPLEGVKALVAFMEKFAAAHK